MKTGTKVLIGLIGVGVPLIGAAGLFVWTFDPNDYRSRVAAELRSLTGREVRLDGPMSLGLSLTPGLIAQDVTIGTIAGASQPHLAKMARLEVQVALMPLLMERAIEVKKLILTGADVHLERLAGGQVNWSFGTGTSADGAQAPAAPAAPAGQPQAASAPVTLPLFDLVQLVDSRVRYRDAATGRSHDLKIENFETRLAGVDAPLPLVIKGALDGAPLDMTAEIRTLAPLLAGQGVLPLVMKGQVLGLTVDIDARAGLGGALGTGEGKIQASGQSLAPLAGVLGRPLPDLPPFKLLADVNLSAQAAQFKDFQLTVGSTEVTLKGRLDRNGGTSAILVTATVPKPQELADAFKMQLPLSQPLSLSATLGGTLLKPESRDFSLSYGPGSMRGPVTLDLSGAQPQFTADIVGTLSDGKLISDLLNFKEDLKGPVTLVGKFSGSPARIEGRDLDVKILDASLKGRVLADLSGAQPRFDGQVTVSVPTPAAFTTLMGIDAPIVQPVFLAGRLSGTATGFQAQEMDLRIGATRITGDTRVTLAAPRPKIVADLQSANLDLDSLLPPPAAKPGETGQAAPARPAASGGRVFSDQEFDLDPLKALDADISLSLAQVRSGTLRLSAVEMRAVLNNGGLVVRPFSFGVAAGQMQGEVSYNARSGALRTVLDGKGIDTKALLTALGQDPVIETMVDLTATLTAKGDSLHELAGSLTGRTSVETTKVGIFNHRYIAPLSGDLAKLMIPNHAGSDQLQCFVSDTVWRDGVGTIRMLGADTKILAVSGKGQIDLGEETLAVRVDPRKREQSLTSLAPPVTVGGTFANPTFTPDLAALAGAVLSGEVGQALQQSLGQNNPLGQILGAVTRPPTRPAATGTARPAAVPSACGMTSAAAAPVAAPAAKPAARPAARPAVAPAPVPATRPANPLQGIFQLPKP